MKKYILIFVIAMILILPSCGKMSERGNNPEETMDNTQETKIESMEWSSSEIADNTEPPSEVTATTATEPETTEPGDFPLDEITEDDFKIIYNGVEISAEIPFKEIADNLGISLTEINYSNVRANSRVNGVDYLWYQMNYPSDDNTDFTIEYVVNETTGDSYIVSILIYKGETIRGVKVGDSEEDLLTKYGNKVKSQYNGLDEVCYYYILDGKYKEYSDKYDDEIDIVVDTRINQVIRIRVYYNNDRAFEDLDIVAFD